MTKEKRQLDKQNFVEEMGLIFERLSVPRMAGRVLGWLLICDPPHQSMQELTEALGASKASISNTTRLLIEVGLIERLSLPGFRYDHYRLKPGAWFHLIEKRIAETIAVRRLAERGLKLLEGEDPTLKTRLEEMKGIYLYFEQELPALLEHWEQLQTAERAEVEVAP